MHERIVQERRPVKEESNVKEGVAGRSEGRSERNDSEKKE
jgi:hypothetical protein